MIAIKLDKNIIIERKHTMSMFARKGNTKTKFFSEFFPSIIDHTDWIVVFPELNNKQVDGFVYKYLWAKKDENTDEIQAVKIKESI